MCVFSVMWYELLLTSAISCPLWSSVWYVCDVRYAVLSVRVSCFVVRGCAVVVVVCHDQVRC